LKNHFNGKKKICRVTGTTHTLYLIFTLCNAKIFKSCKFAFRWGDGTLYIDSDGSRYLELSERQTKTHTGENISDVREVSPNMYECPGDRNPVALYELYASKRPTGMRDPSDLFYIATRTIPLTGTEGEQWFVRQRVGEKKLASIMKTTKQKAGLETNKRLTNHSVRKYLVQMLKDNNVEDTDIMQISGHKSVQSVRNYSAITNASQMYSRVLTVTIRAYLFRFKLQTPASTNVSRAIAAST
jgi:hypothetical protein